MTNDKVNPTGQIDSQATTIIKIHSILIVWLFVLTGEHWNQQSESYSKKCAPANPHIYLRVIGLDICHVVKFCIPPSESKSLH